MSAPDDFKPLVVGKVNGAYGIKGWIKIYSYTDPKENILSYNPWYMKVKGQWLPLEITQGREQGKTVVAHIKGCDDRNLAESYHGNELAIDQSQLPQLEGDDYYWRDLVGLSVINLQGEDFGVVKKLMETGANDVLVVQIANEDEVLIPFVLEHSVVKVDLAAKLITVDWQTDYS